MTLLLLIRRTSHVHGSLFIYLFQDYTEASAQPAGSIWNNQEFSVRAGYPIWQSAAHSPFPVLTKL
jgi:hypothetical protein